MITPARSAPTKALYENFGRPQTDRARLAQVSPQRLWDVVLNRRAKNGWRGENPVTTKALAAAQQAGLEDPLEIVPGMLEHVVRDFKYGEPQNDLAKADWLMMSIVPRKRDGLTEAQGGLGISYSADPLVPLRQEHGGLLPKILMNAFPQDRVAVCVEFSNLLIAFLRLTGLEAHSVRVANPNIDHVYVAARLEGQDRKLDLTGCPYTVAADGIGKSKSDRHNVAMHYGNKGYMRLKQGRVSEALKCFDQALELDPCDDEVWINKGKALMSLRRFGEARRCFEQAIKNRKRSAPAWKNLGEALEALGRPEYAIVCLDRAIKINLYYDKAWKKKEAILRSAGRIREADKCSREMKPILAKIEKTRVYEKGS